MRTVPWAHRMLDYSSNIHPLVPIARNLEESHVMRRIACFAIAILCLGTASVLAQGQQYGSVSGRASSPDDLALPGVTVTATSDASQGSRTAITDVNGVYSLPGLAPGHYLLKFEIDGMNT